MTIPANSVYLCPNGHGPPASPGARFCTQCGAPFVPAGQPAPVAGQPMPMDPRPSGNGIRPAQSMAYRNPQLPSVVGTPAPPVPPLPAPAGTPQAAPVLGAVSPVATNLCPICRGDGTGLEPHVLVCPQCRWLRPLAPGYVVHPNAFQWGADSVAMAKLRSLTPLTTLARTVSDKVGRRWIESTFNAILLGEQQLPHIYAYAIHAARLIGMPMMPDIYVSGDKMWDAVTYGSDHSAFLIIGTALINNYKDDDLLFLLAREMGHCRAGHALWKTVGMFLVGAQGPHSGLMAGGLMGALNPDKLMQSALEVPFLAWARQAEITADRAGMMAVGDEETARRVLLSWSLRSLPLYRQVNIDAWLQQQEDSDDQMTRISELITSPTPYITRRLKLLTQFARSAELAGMRAIIAPLTPPLPKAPAPPVPRPAAPPPPAAPAQAAAPSRPPVAVPMASADTVRVTCPTCGTGMHVPRAALAGKDVFRVRCPNAQCGKVLTMQKKVKPAAPTA